MTGYRHNSIARQLAEPCLDTPRVVGYRSEISATSLIGRRLANVYDVATVLPHDMGTLLRTLGDKVDR